VQEIFFKDFSKGRSWGCIRLHPSPGLARSDLMKGAVPHNEFTQADTKSGGGKKSGESFKLAGVRAGFEHVTFLPFDHV
jgi:hypothetical protein